MGVEVLKASTNLKSILARIASPRDVDFLPINIGPRNSSECQLLKITDEAGPFRAINEPL